MLGRVISIDIVPDDILLETFCFYVGEDLLTQEGILVGLWRTLVHVCRRWRSIVFASPRRLKLRLICTPRTPTRRALDVWPALPLIIHGHSSRFVLDNLIAALERRDRVCKIDLVYYISLELGKFWTAMQEPFPELTHLCLEARARFEGLDPELRVEKELLECPGEQDVSDSFLGGSAPRLQFFRMNAVRLQGLQKLLLSATHLIVLHLTDIPDYISSQWMATCLSVLTSLQTFYLTFQPLIFPPYRESRHPSPPTRIVLPALKDFHFTGVSKFLENLLTLIDAPGLNKLSITFNRHVSNTPELAQFVSRIPKLGVPNEARMVFHDFRVAVKVKHPSPIFGHELLNVGISSGDFQDIPTSNELDSQLSCLAKVCASLLPTISTVENLYIYEDSYSALEWDEDMENALWLDLLRPFVGLKNLYLFEKFAKRIASALEVVDEGTMADLLPNLQNVFVRWQSLQPSGHIRGGISPVWKVIAAQLIGGRHDRIAVFPWDTTFDETSF